MRVTFVVAAVLASCCVLWCIAIGTRSASDTAAGVNRRDGVGDGSAPFAATSGAFARRVLAPKAGLVDLPEPGRLDVVLQRLRPNGGSSLGGLLHAIHLYGDGLAVVGESGDPARVLGLVLDADMARQAGKGFGDGQVFARTSHGLRFALADTWKLSVDQANTEYHPGQGLAALATAGVPLDARISSPGGADGRVGDVLADLVANFSLEGEIFWEAVALAFYLPPNRSWGDKFGKVYTFDDLSDELLRRPLDGSSCAGTHILIALTTILRSDMEAPLLSPGHRTALRSHLRGVVERLERSRLDEGGWAHDWSEPGGIETAPREVIIATGHHLEWLMLLPDDLRPGPSVLGRAAEHSLRLLLEKSEDPEWVRTNYCPAIHAARSAWLLAHPESRTRFDP
jgi:hypothetical protein